MVAGAGATCSLTRVVSLHATHHYDSGGPMQPHGHLYRIEVTVGGRLAPDASALIDLEALDTILTREVAQPLAERDLNVAVADFGPGGRQPTCEALAVWCWQQIAPRLPDTVQLERIRVAEDGTLWAECSGLD